MTKQEYLKELAGYLHKLAPQDVREILADYEEHFDAGRAAGKSEQQIVDSLGSTKTVSQEIMVNNLVSRAENSTTVSQKANVLMRMLVAFLILAPLNFFMIIGPFLLLLCLLMCGWLLPVVGIVGAIALVVMVGYGVSLIPITLSLSLLFMFTGTLGLVVMTGIVMILLTKGVLSLLVTYLKWNMNFITTRNA